MIYSIPIAGYIAKSIVTLVTFPRFLKRLNALENYVAQEAIFSHHNDLLLEKELNQKAEISELESLLNEIKKELNQKAEIGELESL
jgi:hypothetical protein